MLQLYSGDVDFSISVCLAVRLKSIWCRLVNVNEGLVMFWGHDDCLMRDSARLNKSERMSISRGSRGRLTALHAACNFYQTVLVWQNDKCCSFKEGRETHIFSQQTEQRPRGRNEKAWLQNKWRFFYLWNTQSIILTQDFTLSVPRYLCLHNVVHPASTNQAFLIVHHITGAVKSMWTRQQHLNVLIFLMCVDHFVVFEWSFITDIQLQMYFQLWEQK